MARISTKNQITLPVAALQEAGLHAGEAVTVEPAGDGELRVRRAALGFEDAFGAMTGDYPPGYLARLDREDAQR
jgi:bifunctional DNA-binding transcriptional regulator/antitoxin component of YhaV-PrlF toxin-antitoxin module